MSAPEAVHDVVVVGAGVVGCAIARALAPYELDVVVLEREADLCEGTSKANTAVLHTGFDCVPGSLESQLVATGGADCAPMRCAAASPSRPWARSSSPGTKSSSMSCPASWPRPRPTATWAARSSAPTRSTQPSPPWALVRSAASPCPTRRSSIPGACHWPSPWRQRPPGSSSGSGPHSSRSAEGGTYELETSLGTVRSRWLINAAGLSSAEVDGLCAHHDFRIVPRRGELLVFDKLARGLVTSVILPVPTARTKGMLVSPTVFGNLLVGPTADDIEDPTATATTTGGIDRLVAGARRLVPALADEEVTASYAGIRAATEHSDYQIRAHPGEASICVGGIRSTGLTAAPAIARHVLGLLEAEGLVLEGAPRAARRAEPGAARRGPAAALPRRRPHRAGPGLRRDRLPLRARHPRRAARRDHRSAPGQGPRRAPPPDQGDERALPGLLLRGGDPRGAGLADGSRPRAADGARAVSGAVEEVDVAIVGGGPAGLSAALELRRRGIGRVLVLEREAVAGGVPRHCAHQGFGLRDRHRPQSGPRYAASLVEAARRAGVDLRTSTTVTSLEPGRLSLSSPSGLGVVEATALLLATGARERPRAARLIPGDRPAGVLTTGQLQQLAAAGLPVGRRALVVGAELVSFSAVLSLRHAGVEVVGMLSEHPVHQAPRGAATAARLGFGVMLRTSTRLVEIRGRSRVREVVVEHLGTGRRELWPATPWC